MNFYITKYLGPSYWHSNRRPIHNRPIAVAYDSMSLPMPMSMPTKVHKIPGKLNVITRKDFPETWMCDNIDDIGLVY